MNENNQLANIYNYNSVGALINTNNNGIIFDVQKRFDPITSIGALSNVLSGDIIVPFNLTDYTRLNSINDLLLFQSAEITRLYDLENELREFEKKFKITSEVFYKNWKTDPTLDKADLNKWADLYKTFSYAKR